jgi:hypothetical protein
MAGFSIGQVYEPRYLSILGGPQNQVVHIDGQTYPTDPHPALETWEPRTGTVESELVQVEMDVYTGVLLVGIPFGMSLHQVTMRTFLPVEPGVVKDYSGSSLVDFTATASPAVVEPVEDEATFYGVDGVPDVQIVPQPQLVGDPECLEMSVAFAGQRVTFHRITYQVTVLVRMDTGGVRRPSFIGERVGITPDTEPA